MSQNHDYNDSWQDGYWAGSGSAYDRGYEEGVQAERRRIRRAVGDNPTADEASTLGSMLGGSIVLTIFGLCFVGVIQLLGWIGGASEAWWFPWIWRIAFWCGIGFIVLMSIAGAIMAFVEHREAKKPPGQPTDNQNVLWHKKYPPADVVKDRGRR